MNPEDLRRKLIEAARAHPPTDHVPCHFEQRVIAHVRKRPAPDPWSLWGRALWRAATPCLTLTLGLTVWTLLAPQSTNLDDGLDAALDDALISAVDSTEGSW